MAIFRKGGQRKVVEDHLTERINVLLAQGWAIEDAPPTKKSGKKPLVTVLPDDFPGRAALLAAGLATVEAVQARKDSLQEIPGIGPVTAEAINAAL